MNNILASLREQIQEDIRSYAACENPPILTTEQVDFLCYIVVINFDSLYQWYPKFAHLGQVFKIEEIEFDIDWDEDLDSCLELQNSLVAEWEGRVIGPILEDDLVDYITEKSGWCINYIKCEPVENEQ